MVTQCKSGSEIKKSWKWIDICDVTTKIKEHMLNMKCKTENENEMWWNEMKEWQFTSAK